jgi:hypothetical protein
MSKTLKLTVDTRIASVKKKMGKYQEQIQKRQAESKAAHPGKTILEIETMEDWVDMAALAGELKGLKFIKAKL